MRIWIAATAVLLVALMGLAQPQIQRIDQTADDKIAPWLLEQAAQTDEMEYLVILTEQADISGARLLRTKEEKSRYVFKTLYRTAQQTQIPILSWLKDNGVEHRPFYIVNMVLVRSSLKIALQLASRLDVKRIEGNPRILNIPDPPKEDGDELTSAPMTIESGISYTRAPEVWAAGFTGQGVVVGGADTGYRWDHNALKQKYRGWNGSSANHDYNWHDSIHSGGGSCGADSPQPCDDNRHGTHTMGTAVGDDGLGNQIGMAPGAKWIGCRNMNQGVGTPATYMECFEFFLAPYPVGGSPAQGDPSKSPHVTINSWSCPPSEGCSATTLQAAVEAQRAAGIITVVAAGNEGSGCSTVASPPAIYDAAYSVGALVNGFDSIASFSSRGPVLVDGSNRLKPDISAPGTSVRSATNTSISSYVSLQGTSMATPHVAGAAALLMSAEPSLKNNVDEVETILNDSAFQISSTSCNSSGTPNNVFGHGRLDVKAAVDMVAFSVTADNQYFSASGGQGSIQVIAQSNLAWSAVSSATWIELVHVSAGSGSGVVPFVVRNNISTLARQGTITVAGRMVTITQGGFSSSCTYTVSPVFANVAAVGGTANLNLATSSDCAWRVSTDSTWITLVTPCCGIGSTTISYSVAANPGPTARKGRIIVSGRVFSIKQMAP